MKARTAATLITDHKRKIVAACIPDLHVTDGINYTTELHATSRMRPVLKGLIKRVRRKGKRLDVTLKAVSGCRQRCILETRIGRNAICVLRKLIKVTPQWTSGLGISISSLSARSRPGCRMACARVSFVARRRRSKHRSPRSSAGHAKRETVIGGAQSGPFHCKPAGQSGGFLAARCRQIDTLIQRLQF